MSMNFKFSCTMIISVWTLGCPLHSVFCNLLFPFLFIFKLPEIWPKGIPSSWIGLCYFDSSQVPLVFQHFLRQKIWGFWHFLWIVLLFIFSEKWLWEAKIWTLALHVASVVLLLATQWASFKVSKMQRFLLSHNFHVYDSP